jgi:hypothetical protein
MLIPELEEIANIQRENTGLASHYPTRVGNPR